LLPVARAVIELLLSADTVACYRMVVAEASRLPELGAAYYQGGAERLLNRLEQYFTTAIEGGQLRAARPRVMAEHFVGLVRGDLQLRALLGIKNDLFERQKDVAIRVGVDAFYRAYAPDLGRG
jgi:TetR/AcrR family transcriptional regulator, mexJK operon transcriptional repressor